MAGAQLGPLMLGVKMTLRTDAVAACVHVRRVLGSACCMHAIFVVAIGEDRQMVTDSVRGLDIL